MESGLEGGWVTCSTVFIACVVCENIGKFVGLLDVRYRMIKYSLLVNLMMRLVFFF